MPKQLAHFHRTLANEPALVVMDCRVVLHRIIAKIEQVQLATNGDQDKIMQWFTFIWAMTLNDPMPWLGHQPAKGMQVVIVDDFKRKADGKYWRTDYYESYKGNRSLEVDRPKYYHDCLKALNSYIAPASCPIELFREEGFEADDFAGAICRKIALLAKAKRWYRECFLLTIDTDWSQLVSDLLNIRFANVCWHKMRLRTDMEVLQYCLNTLGEHVSEPAGIVAIKQKKGDDADNIKAGAPIGIIDLLNPAIAPNTDRLDLYLEQPAYNTLNKKHYNAARGWIIRNGLPMLTAY